MGMWQKQKDYHHLVCLFKLKIYEKLKPKFDCTMNISQVGAGFPTGVEKMWGGSSKFDRGLSQYMGEAWGELKMLSRNIYIVASYKPAILQIY